MKKSILTDEFQFYKALPPDQPVNKKLKVEVSTNIKGLKFPKPVPTNKDVKKWNKFIESRNYFRTAKYLRRKPVARRKHKKQQKLPKKKTIKQLEAKLKSVLYPLIKREEDNICVSCGKLDMKGRDHQVGHFIKAELCNLMWRYNRKILHPQCSACNLWKWGNYVEYRKWMVEKYGEIEVGIIEQIYNEPLPMKFNSREFLLSEIKKYGSNDK